MHWITQVALLDRTRLDSLFRYFSSNVWCKRNEHQPRFFVKQTKITVQTDSQKEYSGTEVLLDAEEDLAGYNLDVVKSSNRGWDN